MAQSSPMSLTHSLSLTSFIWNVNNIETIETTANDWESVGREIVNNKTLMNVEGTSRAGGTT